MRNTLRKTAIILLGILGHMTIFGQVISTRLILSDTKDSILIKAHEISFDKLGNYCFQVNKGDKKYLYTDNDTIGPFKSFQSIASRGNSVSYTDTYPSKGLKPWYYKNYLGTKFYGPALGEIELFLTSNTREHIALSTTIGDSVHYYLNDRLISKTQRDSIKKLSVTIDKWCAFSENGNRIYYVKQDSLYKLYVNDRLIDTSYSIYRKLAINNQGRYTFGKGRKLQQAGGKYDFTFFIHTPDTIFDQVSTVWFTDLKNNGGYYYSGKDNSSYYLLINDHLHRHVENTSNVTIFDQDTYFYAYQENGIKKIKINDRVYTHDFVRIVYPTLDNQGNFAYFGLKDYNYYKVVNGQKEEQPIRNHGLGATPIYISPKGESVHYTITVDSVYIYRDDQMLFPPITRDSNFVVRPLSELLSHHDKHDRAGDGNSLLYMAFDSVAYFVINGVFSKPMIPINGDDLGFRARISEIAAGVLNDFGFAAIQKVGPKKFEININNKTYHALSEVDHIFRNHCFLDQGTLIFYGIKGLSFYRFELTF